MTLNGIRQVKSVPYHPFTNGLAERAIQTLNENSRKSKTSSLETRISHFLFKYRTTPHTTTGVSPAELLMDSFVHTYHYSTLILQYLTELLIDSKIRDNYDSHARKRHFTIGDTVFVHDFLTGKKWLPGTVTQVRGPPSFLVTLDDGRVMRRHIDHIRQHSSSATSPRSSCDEWPVDTIPHHTTSSITPPVSSHTTLRRSSHIRKPPDSFS